MNRVEAPPHLLQLNEADDRALVANVTGYLGEAMRCGAPAIAIVTEARRPAIATELRRRGCQVARELADRRLTLLDTKEALAELTVDGHPDAQRFNESIGALIRAAMAAPGGKGLRVYSELVGPLWDAAQFAAAIRLEDFWGRLQREHPFSLFCSYPIDVFGRQFDGHVVNALLCSHTHLLPTDVDDRLERALARAVQDLLGLNPEGLRNRIHDAAGSAWGAVPYAEGAILWLRREYPRYADTILESAKTYYLALPERRGGLQAM